MEKFIISPNISCIRQKNSKLDFFHRRNPSKHSSTHIVVFFLSSEGILFLLEMFFFAETCCNNRGHLRTYIRFVWASALFLFYWFFKFILMQHIRTFQKLRMSGCGLVLGNRWCKILPFHW